jgi:hypothetical protein
MNHIRALQRRCCVGLSAALLVLLSNAAWAEVVTTATGATLTTSTSPTAQGTRMAVTITPSPQELNSTQKMYFALALPSGVVLFRTGSGWQAWGGGALPALFSQAQTDCKEGQGFGYHVDFPGITDLAILKQMGLGGATFFAGYGDNDQDLIAHQKFAPIYSVPK